MIETYNPNNLLDTIELAITKALTNVHTVLIARVESVGQYTIDCAPVINRVVNGADVRLPTLIEVPPCFMRGGASYTAHPIAVGDYALILITERCYDNWYFGNDFHPPAELRMHDYSDGFAMVCISPQAGAIEIPTVIMTVGDAQHDGALVHNGDTTHTGALERTGDTTLAGDTNATGTHTQTGAMSVSGTLTAGALVVSGGVKVGGLDGVSGAFTTADSKTVTVTNGVITAIV